MIRGPALVRRSPDASLGTVLADTAGRYPDTRQTYWSEGVFTSARLSELEQMGARFAAALHSLGVRAGDVVAVQMPNRLETAIAYRACFAIGAVLCPVVHIYGGKELSFILRQSRARVLIVPDSWRSIDFVERVTTLPACPDLAHIIIVGAPGNSGAIGWTSLMEAKDRMAPPSSVGPDDVALLLYTSGTTADPKGVCHSSSSLLAELDQRRASGDRFDDATFSAWPAGHIGGFGSLIHPQLTGGVSVIMDRWVPEVGVALMAEYRVTRAAGVPVLLRELLDTAAAIGADLSALRSYMTGAANVPAELVERASAQGIGVFRCYGSTEHPTVTACHPTDPLHERARTDGRVLPGGEVRLMDEEGRDVAGVGEGEILTRGPEMFVGYRDADLNADAFLPGGWFRTGDIGRFDGELLIITDRKKDIIIRGGENISSKEVEDVLASHPAILEVAAFAVPHVRLGEGVCVAVRLCPDATLDLEQVSEHFAAAGVARQKTPERLVIVDDMPRTPSGKVKKFELRKLFADSVGETLLP